MSSECVEEIVIAGGGICGLATALALRRKGVDSVVLERSSTLRAEGLGIAIYGNGWRVLDELGVGAELRRKCVVMPLMQDIFLATGARHETVCGEIEFRCLRRSDLVEALAKRLPPGCIRYGSQVVAVDVDELTLSPRILLQDGSTMTAKVLIGCDGANSVVAKKLGMNPPTPSRVWTIRGFTDCPNGHKHGRAFTRLQAGDVTFGMIPIDDTFMHWFISFRWTSEERKVEKSAEELREWGMRLVEGFPEEAAELVMKGDLSSMFLSQIRYRPPWNLLFCSSARKTTAIAGDAIHVMGPFLGQGGACGLEDAIVLARNLARVFNESSEGDQRCRHFLLQRSIEVALKEYARERRLRVLRVSTQTYLMGLLIYHPFKVVKVMVFLVLLAFFGGTDLRHTAYDCGRL